MKLALSRFVGLAAVAILLGTTMPAFAQTATTMTDEHIAKIRSNCQLARASLSQIHANDAPTYVNRNQTYFSIGDKMMATLNGRLSLNRYDASELVKTASEYNDLVSQFRDTYRKYNDAMSDAIGTDCAKQPVGFYDKVAGARDARQKLHDVIVKLTDTLNDYKSQVRAFSTKNFSSPGESQQ